MIPIEFLVAAAVALLVLMLVARWVSRRARPSASAAQAMQPLAVESLGDHPPPLRGTRLMVYNTPVWLAAVVIAPAGRDRVRLSAQVVPPIADVAVPGLQEVMLQHRSRIIVWPAELSSCGFTHRFANFSLLPGDGGRGTPWCSVAGSFQLREQGYVMGLVCRADRANNLGQILVESGRGWLDIVRTSTEA